MIKTTYHVNATAAEIADAITEDTGKMFVKAAEPERYVCRGIMIEDSICTLNNALNNAETEKIIHALNVRGYAPAKAETVDTEASAKKKREETQKDEKPKTTLSMPNSLDEKGVRILKSFVYRYGNILKHAAGCESVDIEITDEQIAFPWFYNIENEHDLRAWMVFVNRLCITASEKPWVHKVKKPITSENERYCFRTLLRQIGMEGTKYKAERVRLMDKLQGDAAFKTPRIRERKRK